MNTDTLKWTPVARVDKYDQEAVSYVRSQTGLYAPHGDALAEFATPYETLVRDGNALTTAGLNRMTGLLTGASSSTMDSTRARLGVGDSATAFSAADAALSASTGQYFRVLDSTYPQQSNGLITLKATYADAEANFAWACWGVDLGTATVTSGATPNALLVNRKVTDLGTKVSGTWVLTVTLTFS